MRILWITNILLPPICKELEMNVPPIGGWMYSSLKRLVTNSNDQFAVATVYSGREFISKEIDDVTYYLLPLKGKSTIKYNKYLEEFWRTINTEYKPDVIHIHGSEYPHGLAYVRACGSKGVVVSLQGIISCIARYYTAGIESHNIKKYLTFRDFIKRDNLSKSQQSFARRGEHEKELLRSVRHIIGRTDWDKTHAWAINQDATYHYCGETLRDSFYTNKWSYSKCQPHSIFVSQASYPIKGLHMLIRALPLIIRNFPDTMVNIAGYNPTNLPFWRITGYGKYLRQLIKELAISDHIKFTGPLDERAMCRQYLRSNVFVCCSSIENSPNSLGEAQLLGVPHVASFVGGVPEIVNWDEKALYRFEEYEMLANKICNIFMQGKNFKPSDFKGTRYDINTNSKLLHSIYKEICK